MLQNLSIRDFILIEKLDLDFNSGFCVITGQTGAGKSILLDAILFALGSRDGSEIIRSNQDQAIVTLTFSSSKIINEYLINSDIEPLEDLIIKRVQQKNGRKKFLVNDQIVSHKIVSELFDYLLEINGQHNHTALLNSTSHIEILDQFADNKNLSMEVANLYKSWQSINNEICLIENERANIIKEIEYLSHICQEFDNLNVQEGEEQELIEIKKNLKTRDAEIKLIDSILNDIDSSNIESIIARAQKNMSKSQNSDLYESIYSYFDEIYNKIEETKSSLNQILHNFELPNHDLATIEDRLYEIRSLARKHGCATSELADFINKSKEQLAELELKIQMQTNLNDKMDKIKAQYLDKARFLSQSRQIAAKELESKTMQELEMLDMKKAVFCIDIETSEFKQSAKGIDEVRFLASTNPGTPKSPIDKIASGGELSRFMLAFRAALFDKCGKKTVIFDEIDVGISGKVADAIGNRLKLLSKVAQVIVITHQPQVAGKANQHILVRKIQENNATSVHVVQLDLSGRSSELARMISGKEITAKSLEAAKELIDFQLEI